MAHESFEDSEIAEILNQNFISIKVDKEERPDIDSIYMSVCQAFTGSGGWPTTIFLTPEQKPFFAGTYFPKTAKYGRLGLREILIGISRKWQTDRATLIKSADDIISFLDKKQITQGDVDEQLADKGFTLYQRMFDEEYGGFFLYGEENESLILRPKETYDGAVFSGNSAMAYNLVQLDLLTDDREFEDIVERQLQFVSSEAKHYPAGYAMFLVALSDYSELPREITVVLKDKEDLKELPFKVPLDSVVRVLEGPTEEYGLKNDKTTFYVCEGHTCKPPVNELL